MNHSPFLSAKSSWSFPSTRWLTLTHINLFLYFEQTIFPEQNNLFSKLYSSQQKTKYRRSKCPFWHATNAMICLWRKRLENSVTLTNPYTLLSLVSGLKEKIGAPESRTVIPTRVTATRNALPFISLYGPLCP